MQSTFSYWKSKYPESWFSVNPGKNGFLPVGRPYESLPIKYYIIDWLLNKMRINQKDNGKGLLANNLFAKTVDEKLPYFDMSLLTDKKLIACLYRDYCFLASAYSLETSHYHLQRENPWAEYEEGEYGKARTNLPPNISKPLLILSQKVKNFPWLEYSYGYGLNNAVLVDHKNPGHPDSYRAIRMFNGNNSEEGFINTHVAMVSYSGKLLEEQQNILKAAHNFRTNESPDLKDLATHLNNHFKIFLQIVESLNHMWKACKKSKYLSFRTFIMGQKGNKKMYPDQSIVFNFPDGTKQSHSYRGETGAQDSLIPSIDNLFDINYPKNKLTEYLYDLRQYRPKDHQEYIEYNNKMSKNVKLIDTICLNAECGLAFLKNLNILRLFRRKHWNITKVYIIKNTKHPVATGGTPITTWLPNQLGATIETMNITIQKIDKISSQLTSQQLTEYNTIKLEVMDHYKQLLDEVNELQNSFEEQEHHSFLTRI
jgi:indoleamine 2,3-dioxygenase